MEDSNKLKEKQMAVAETASNRNRMENPNNSEAEQGRPALPDSKNSSNSREEGELSTSDEDENQPLCSTSLFTGVNAAQVKSMEVELVKDSYGIEAGRHVSSNTLARLSSRASHESNCHKNSDKNRGSFVPFLISFSDDDSGSDSEDSGQKNSLATESRSLSVDKSRKTPQAAAAVRRPQKLEKMMRNEAKVMRKMPHSHTFVSSLPKISGATSRSGGSSLNVRNYNNFKKTAGPYLVRKTNTILDNSKLQDLRQLIAIRENELKLKSAQQSKNFSSIKCRDPSVMITSNGTTSVCRATDAENMQHELKEPSNKLQRISEDHSSQMVQNVQVIDTALASEKSMLDNCGQPGLGDRSSHNEKFPSGASCTGFALHHSENENQGSFFLTKLAAGTDVVTSQSQSGWKTNLRDCVIASEEAAVANKSGEVELKGPIKLSDQFIPGHAGKILTGRSSSLRVRSNEQPLQPATHNVNQEPLNIQHFPSNSREVNISGNSNMDLQSLLDMEELHDKELEEAQEYRHKCEIEERNALKAYRKAQKALIEANARCSTLFSKREKYSAQIRLIMIENPDMFLSTGSHLETGGMLNHSTNSGANMHLIPSSCCPAPLAFDGHDHRLHDVDLHSAFDAIHNVSGMHVDRDKLASDPFSEPDVSTSELNKDNDGGNGVCLQSDDVSMSAEEEDGSFQKSPQNSSEYQGEGTFGVVRDKEVNNGSGRELSIDSSQDSLLLEASLRSQLFERLKMTTLPKKADQTQSVEPITENMLEVDDVGQRMGMSSGNISSSEVEKEKEKASDFQVCSDKADVEFEAPIEINDHCTNEKFGSNLTPLLSTDHLSSCLSIDDQQSQSSSSAAFSLPALRSAFSHLKVLDPTNFGQLQTRSMNMQSSHVHEENDDENVGSILDPDESASLDLHYNMNGSYSSKFDIDPLWPLCMYELRGKCNDNECTWQHFRDYSCENKMNTTCNSSDFKDESAIQRGKICATKAPTKSLDCLLLAPPTYLVGFDVLKTDLPSCKSIVAQSNAQHRLKCFSGFLVLSSLLPTDLASKEPFLHGTEARVEVHGGWNRQLLYFHSRNGTSVKGDQFSDNDQSIELALLSLCQESNKNKGRIEALKVLARALEADPTSALLWIFYLLIYYSNQKYIGKDDMFQHAVEHNEEAYELWVLFINSREKLDERLTAYDAAISALCRHASASNRDTLCASECILDIVLQMMNFLCMSGNVGKAIEKIHELFPTTKRSEKPHQLFLPDIITCLAISDKCIFWVCCVYMVVYRRLPNAIVKQLECQKDLSAIEWPSTQLTADEKQQAVSLMELAVDSLALYIDRESLEDESNLRAAHLFTLNHVRCVAVLEGLECSRNLLERYSKLYPSCVELVLMSARVEHDFQNMSFEGFEEALNNWLDGVPGVQCIWNQYAECAFRDGRLDFVKEVMDRWFRSFGSEDSNDSPQSASVSDVHAWLSGSSQNDIVFGLLNCAIYKLLQNDQTEARLAVDRALGAANTENYDHCVRELILFLTADSLQCNGYTRVGRALQLLKGYMFDSCASLASEPLSRKFIQNIKKPRLRQLAGKLLSPVPSDPSLVNSILEVWFGPSLLPHIYSKLTDMVDLVESLMEILPSNYQLAISVCKWLSRVRNTASFPCSVSFWASSLLSNALFQAIPLAPEHIWVEAADLLHNMTNSQAISISFHRRALSIYPFSIKLWKSYVNLSMATGDAESVKEAAREKGINLN